MVLQHFLERGTFIMMLLVLFQVKRMQSFDPGYCVGVPDGWQINNKNCGTFYDCKSGVATLFYCAPGLIYSAAHSACVSGAHCPFTCPTPLDNPHNGLVNHVAEPKAYDSATYTCNEGYKMVGSLTRTCGPDGSWKGFQPSCIIAARGVPTQLHMTGTRTLLGYRFAGAAIAIVDAIGSTEACADECRSTENCVSANYLKLVLRCELLSTKPPDYNVLQYLPFDFDFIQILNPLPE